MVISVKIKVLTHVYFVPPLTGFPLELGIGTMDKKTRMMGYQAKKRSLTISSAVRIQYMNVTVTQMVDGNWATAQTALTHSVAW